MATWNQRDFLGNPYVTIPSITMGTIDAARTTATGVPAIFHFSASAVTCTGSSKPYEDLEFFWEVISGAEAGVHTFDLSSWRNPIVNGTPLATTVDTQTGQYGPEALFRFFEAGNKTIRCTARGKNGGAYTTASTTIDVTITATGITAHRWYDSDNGVDANDGLDAWGFNVSGGTFTNATKRLTKTGAFATYDHTAATAPTDVISRYNYVYIKGGTGVTVGLYQIAAKISDDTIELTADIGGTNPTDVTTATGPRKTTAGTNLASGRAMHFKTNTTALHTLPSTSQLRSKVGCRFVAYGTGYWKSTVVQYGTAVTLGETAIDHHWHRLEVDRAGAGTLCFQIGGSSADSTLDYLGVSECRFLNCTTKAVNVSAVGAETQLGHWFWGCTMDTPASTESSMFLKHNMWCAVVGGSITGTGPGTQFHHHIYPQTRGHMMLKWITFGSGVGRNYNVNMNFGGSDGVTRNYFYIGECLITGGTERAWDASHGGQVDGSSGENCYGDNYVCERNVITGLIGAGQVLFYHCYGMTVRDNVIYGNTGGRFFDPSPTWSAAGNFKLYSNQAYTAMASNNALFYLYHEIPACTFRENKIWDTRTTDVESFKCDFTAHDVEGQTIYNPNNSGLVVIDNSSGSDVGKTFAQYVSGVDSTAVNTSPGWIDPANGDFSTSSPSPPSASPSQGRWAPRILLGMMS